MRKVDIRELVRHLDKQIGKGEATEPNAQWCVKELKNYLNEKDADSFIDNVMESQAIKEVSSCEWCEMPLKPEEEMYVTIEKIGRFRVCIDCLNDYANQQYAKLTARIRQVRGDPPKQKE